ncbi:efflux RND transporter periplasmic adaptor subunit [Limnoglobus roseus]|uniref:Efflux RND transporter periplasmic adaptor subunit n=1 Tax=Limnoglobus roseus TaxID=2598579 RepID=A0A5C1AEF6_9BACT|nr:efflux RND transporter periplasmic adaptor subunit [Limnoglobus roseus]
MTPLPTLPPRQPPARKGTFRTWGRRFVTVGVVATVGYLGWKYGLSRFTGSRSIDRPLTAVVQRGELKITITDRGELESIDAVQVTCDLEGGGKLVSIIEEGKHVKKGQEVAKLDTDTLLKMLNEQDVKWQTAEGKVKSGRSDLAQAKNKAESEIAKADLALTLAKIDLESYDDPQGEFKRDVDKLKGTLELNKKQLKEAEDDIAFTKGLVKDGYAQLEQIRAKELTVQQRKFEVTSAEADLTLLEKFTRKKKITELKAKADEAERELKRTKETQQSLIEKAEGELKSAESTAEIEKKQLTRLQQQIERCTIHAPSDGIVVYSNSRYWDESARIRPGAQLYYRQEIFSLPDLSRMRVKMKIHESVIKKVKVGMPATFQVEALTNHTLNGKVLKIATIAQADGWRGAGVKQYETTLSLDDIPSDAGLKPGMTADVKILIGVLPDAVSVPVGGVTEYESQKVVYAVTPTGITRRDVTVGESNEQYVQVTAGIEPGEEVALDARTRAAADLKATKPEEKK